MPLMAIPAAYWAIGGLIAAAGATIAWQQSGGPEATAQAMSDLADSLTGAEEDAASQTGAMATTCVGNCRPSDPECAALYDEIEALTRELAGRRADMLRDTPTSEGGLGMFELFQSDAIRTRSCPIRGVSSLTSETGKSMVFRAGKSRPASRERSRDIAPSLHATAARRRNAGIRTTSFPSALFWRILMDIDPLDALLPQLQQEDGRLWVRILGQAHWQYEELAFWVLVKNREQIAEALPFLQKALAPLRSVPDAKVTVAFMGLSRTQAFSYGMFKGDEFFAPDALDDLYEKPFENPRTAKLFDIHYPDDPYAIVDEEWLRARGRR